MSLSPTKLIISKWNRPVILKEHMNVFSCTESSDYSTFAFAAWIHCVNKQNKVYHHQMAFSAAPSMKMSFVHKRLLQAERANCSRHISFRCTFSELNHTSVNATILSHHVLVPCALELRVILFQITSIRCTFRELKHISVNKRSYPNQVVVPCELST